MSDALDHKLSFIIFHYLHKNISELENPSDKEIKMILYKVLKATLPDLEIEINDTNQFIIKKNNQILKLNIQEWIDKIKILYSSYENYIHK